MHPAPCSLPEGATDAKRQWAEGNSLLKRVGHPEDVARTVLFLVDSDFATGGVYFVDGGRALVDALNRRVRTGDDRTLHPIHGGYSCIADYLLTPLTYARC